MSVPRLIVATGNPGKLREFRDLLKVDPILLGSLADVPGVSLPEEGTDYQPNAIAKARAVAEQAGRIAIADDSGLEVDGLGGAPGPLSARYGGPGLDDSGRVAHLLAELEASRGGARTARFVCVAALVTPAGEVFTGYGICEGLIREAVAGDGGFGYDPIFEPRGHDVTMAELPAEIKNEISHRGRALAALAPELERIVSTS